MIPKYLSVYLTRWRDDGESDLPEESEEVHDVVSASRHLLLALFALLALLLLVVIACEIKIGN